MFKRFHEKSHNNSKTNPSSHTYQQINKSKSALKNKYSQRHRQRKEATFDEVPVLEVLRSESFVYQGFARQQQKHGEGVMMLRNGTVIIGRWYNDLLDGRAVIYTSLGCKVLAQFAQGRFNGWTLVSYRTHLLKCLLFYEGHLDGEKLTFDESQGLWVSAKCTYDGKLLSITHVEKGKLVDTPSFLQSQELKQLLARYVVNQELFVEFSAIEQIEGSSSAYVGFVDEERRPCGLGVICTEKELYAGNFFEGTLEHYGRMLFENGEVYHGQMLGGIFWGRGIYYSPLRNQTHILSTDEHEQLVEKELEGYCMIDIVPSIGGPTSNASSGIRGNTLRLIEDSIEPYYRKQFTFHNHHRDHSNSSQYGRSEDMNAESRPEKERERERDNERQRQNNKQNDLKYIGSLSPGKINAVGEKWLKFGQEEDSAPAGYRRTYSLDKREAAAMRRAEAVDVLKPKHTDPVKPKQSDLIRPKPVEYQSVQIKENMQREEAEDFLKQSPPTTKLMQEIPFNPDGKLGKQSKSLELEAISLTLRNSTLHSNPDPHKNRPPEMSKVNELSQSQSSQQSGNSQQLLTILERNKGYRKRIFY